MKFHTVLFFVFVLFSFQCKNSDATKVIAKEPILKHLVRTTTSPNPPVLFLLHGYGSNEQDLFSFAQHIPSDWLVVSAQAPYLLDKDKYSWYALDTSSKPFKHDIGEVEKSRKLLLQFMDEILTKYKANKDRVVIGGFSQGAIMSLNLGLISPEKVIGVTCFSGKLLENTKSTTIENQALKKLNVFISHGEQDPVLSFQGAVESKAFLESLGVPLVFYADDSAHTISQYHFRSFLDWLKNK